MSKKILNILAVDDDEAILKLVKLYLSSLGHFVDTETSPLKALGRNFRQKVDLIVSDIQMPEMDGFEFIKRFKDKPLMKFVPIVMLTADGDLEQVKNAASFGAMDYIVKPLEKEVGVAKLKKFIDRIAASEILLPPNSKTSAAHLDFKVRIVSLGEDFIKIISSFAVPVGTKLRLQGDLLEHLDVKLDLLTVEDCSPSEEGFLLFLKFPLRGRAEQESIRDWMNRFK